MAEITSGAGLFVHLWNLRFKKYEGFVYVGFLKTSRVLFRQATDFGPGIRYQLYPMVFIISIFQISNYSGMDTHFHPSLFPKHFLLDLLHITFSKRVPIRGDGDSIQYYLYTKAQAMASVDSRALHRY